MAQQQTPIFEHSYITDTVKELRDRADRLNEVLEWADSRAEADGYERELRIIRATLVAINKEYPPKYFN